jgi:hypothetical protein
MKLKLLGAAVLATAVLAALTSSPAMATTLETKGVAENASVTTKWSLKEHVVIWRDTFGATANTCTVSTVEGNTTSPFTVADPGTIGGPITALSWSNCSEGNPVVHTKGSLTVQHIAGTTNGTVRSTGLDVTVPSAFGTMRCTTNNTDLGTINGKKEGSATLTVAAVLSCTIVGSTITEGLYILTSPSHLGVAA